MFNTLFRKLVAVLLLFGLLMSLIFVMIIRYSHNVYHQEAQQKFHSGVAQRFAALAGWTPGGWADANAAGSAFERLVTANPQFQVFVLDHSGRVLEHYPQNVRVAARQVSLRPLLKMLEPTPHLPILGDDPANVKKKQIFSVARLEGNKRPEQYLYVTVHSEEHDEATEGLRLSYITREGIWLIGASIILALAGGLLSLHFVVRPLKQLAFTMDAFRENQFKGEFVLHKEAVASGDEIDVLTNTFYRMAEQIQRQMEEIGKTDATRREFVANVSHDLRTPLASIQGYLETLTLKNGSLSPEERRQYLQIALNQATSLGKLIRTLFYLSKLDTGQIAFEPEAFKIDEVVQDVVHKFALQAQEKNIRLEAQANGKLPFVCGDIALIERALSNLIDNALRHTPEGGAIKLSLERDGEKVWVSVMDSGPGIASEDLPHVFNRFYQGNRSQGQPSLNAGLGLSIVRRILDVHGETVEAANAEGKGALFRFSLRVAENGENPCNRA